jgi:hypothetical protein
MSKASELKAVTSDDVAQAWQDVENAKTAVEALRHRFVTGDDTVTQAEIASQQGVVEWLELVAHRTENQRERYEVEFAVQSRKDLKFEILRDATKTGDELLGLVNALYAAAIAFEDKANAHDLQVRQWGIRAKALQVPNRGAISADHEGLGLEAGGTLLIDEVRVPPINPESVFNLLFNAGFNGGILPNHGSERVELARSIVTRLGKNV